MAAAALRRVALSAVAGSLLAGGVALAAPAASGVQAGPTSGTVGTHHPMFMPTLQGLAAFRNGDSPLTPPAPPCPLPVVPLPSLDTGLGSTPTQVGPCIDVPEAAAPGQPLLGNMAYWGGHVQVHPRIYVVYFGWGRRGAFTTRACHRTRLVEGRVRATLKCDPDGAGKRIADFVAQLGGTRWAGVQSQYYQVVDGVKTYVHNDRNQLGGIWVDDTHPTSAHLTYHDLAVEAERAVAHFHIPASRLWDSNIVVAQPQNFSDPKAQETLGYCAFHDLIEPTVDPADYHGLRPGVPYTNLPYILNQGSGCGENLVNPGRAGRLDGFTIALGHEIEEVVTDPGAEDHIGGVSYGGWYDPLDANENGDKCAYVGTLPLVDAPTGEPGSAGNIRGNRGGTFAVQSLWSNEAAHGLGYCAGTNDLPF